MNERTTDEMKMETKLIVESQLKDEDDDDGKKENRIRKKGTPKNANIQNTGMCGMESVRYE